MAAPAQAAYALRQRLQLGARAAPRHNLRRAPSSPLAVPTGFSLRRAPRPFSTVASSAPKPSAASPSPSGAGTGSGAGRTSRRSLVLLSTALVSTGVLAGIALALIAPRPQIVSLIFPLPTPHPPVPHSKEGKQQTSRIERGLHDLALVKQLKQETVPLASLDESPAPAPGGGSSLTAEAEAQTAPSPAETSLVKKWTVSRPYAATVPGPHSLSAYTLRGPGKFAVPPLVFTTADKRESVLVLHVGSGLCGHEGVVHGGLLATVLDEALGRTALLNLPTNIGVTATLNLKYKKPTFADQYLVVRTELKEQKGRKALVRGRVESVDGDTLVEAEALFVEPRMASFLSNSSVREALK